MLILDTDAASVLAKGKLLDATIELFKDHEVVITPKIEEELEKPLEHGYSYPDRILDRIEATTPSKKERKNYRKRFDEHSVDKGELEAITVAESRDAIFFTMDQAAAKYSEKQDVQTLSFNNLVKLILEREVITREQLKSSIELIEKKDNRKIDSKDIFQD